MRTSLYPIRPRRGLFTGLLAAALATAAASPAAATTYNITTFSDAAIVDGNCTLREALRAADGNVAVDACPAGTAADNIVLPTGTYNFHGQEVLTGAGSLKITSADLNPFHVTIDLHSEDRFLVLASGGTFVIGGIAVINGVAPPELPAGGAILAQDVTLEVTNFRFVSNTAEWYGGALAYTADTGGSLHLAMSHGAFLSNQATNPSPSFTTGAGGLSVSVGGGNDADVRDVAFISNSATDGAGAAEGGALFLRASDAGSTATCVRCGFDGNSVVESAGSFAHGGGAYVEANGGGTVNVADSNFTHNFAHETGGGAETAALRAVAAHSTITLERLFIDDNNGPATNGADTADVTLEADTGSVISLVDSEITFGGATGLVAEANDGLLLMGHLTIADYPAAGARFWITGLSAAWLVNSIVTFNDPGHDREVMAGTLGETSNLVGADPHFVDEPHGNYRLTPPSPAIDSGAGSIVTLRSLDLDHHARIANGATDLGAFEYAALYADDLEVGDLAGWSGRTP
jgi:hypothetical protein